MSRECQGFGHASRKRRMSGTKSVVLALQVALQSNLDQIEVATGRIDEKYKVSAHAYGERRHGVAGAQDADAAQGFPRDV